MWHPQRNRRIATLSSLKARLVISFMIAAGTVAAASRTGASSDVVVNTDFCPEMYLAQVSVGGAAGDLAGRLALAPRKASAGLQEAIELFHSHSYEKSQVRAESLRAQSGYKLGGNSDSLALELLIAGCQDRNGKYQDAAATIGAVMGGGYWSHASPIEQATTFTVFARVKRHRGELREASNALTEASKKFELCDKELPEASRLLYTILLEIARVNVELGELTRATATYKCIEDAQAHVPLTNYERACLDSIQSLDLILRRDIEGAIVETASASKLMSECQSPDTIEVAEIALLRSKIAIAQFDKDAAIQFAQDAHDIARKSISDAHPFIGDCFYHLAVAQLSLWDDQSDLYSAYANATKAVELHLRTLGSSHPASAKDALVLIPIKSLPFVQTSADKSNATLRKEAESCLAVLDYAGDIWGATTCRILLADLYERGGDLDKSIAVTQVALEVLQQCRPSGEVGMVSLTRTLARRLCANHDNESAHLIWQSLPNDLIERHCGREVTHADFLADMGNINYAMGNKTEALELLVLVERELDKQQLNSTEIPAVKINVACVRAKLAALRQDYKKSIDLFSEAVDLERKGGITSEERYLTSLHGLAVSYTRTGQFTKAVEILEVGVGLANKDNRFLRTPAAKNLRLLNSTLQSRLAKSRGSSEGT